MADRISYVCRDCGSSFRTEERAYKCCVCIKCDETIDGAGPNETCEECLKKEKEDAVNNTTKD